MKIPFKKTIIVLTLLFAFQTCSYTADGFVVLNRDRLFVEATTGTLDVHNSNPDGEDRDLLTEDTPYTIYTDVGIEDFKTNSDMEDVILGQAALTLGFESTDDIQNMKLGYDVVNVSEGPDGIKYTWTITMYDGSEQIWAGNSDPDQTDDSKRWGLDWEDISQITGDDWTVYGIDPTNPVLDSKDTKLNYVFHTPTMDPESKLAEYYTIKLRVTLDSKFKVKIKQLEKDSIKIGAGSAVSGGIPVLLPDGDYEVECLFPVSFILSRQVVIADNTPIGSACGSTNIVWGDPGDKKDPREKTAYEFYEGTTGEHITEDIVVYVKDNNPMINMEKVAVYCYYQIGPFENWRLWDYNSSGAQAGLTWYTTLYPPYRPKTKANSISHGYVSEKTQDGGTKKSGATDQEYIQYSTMVGCLKSPGVVGLHGQHSISSVKSDLKFSYDYDEDEDGYPMISWRGNQPFRMANNYPGSCPVNPSCGNSVPSGATNDSFWDFIDHNNDCKKYLTSYPTIMEDKFYDWPGKSFFWVGPIRMKLDKQAHSKDTSTGIDIDYGGGTMHFAGIGSAGRYTLNKKYIILPNRYATASVNPVSNVPDWPQGVNTWPHSGLNVDSIAYTKNNNDDAEWPATAAGSDGGLLMFVRPVGPEGFIIDSYKTARDFSTKVASKFSGDEQGCAINAIRVNDNDRPLFYVAINHPLGQKLPTSGLSATEISQKDLGQTWFRYKMSEYPEMRFYNDSPIFPVISERCDYTKNIDWFDVFPELKNKNPILPKHLHDIFVDANDNYFNTIWDHIVTKVEGDGSVSPSHVLLDYHLPFPSGVGLYTPKGSRLLYELVGPAAGKSHNMYAEAAGKKFHKIFNPYDSTQFDTKYSGTTNWRDYKNKYSLRVGVRHPFHVVLFDNLNNVHYYGKTETDTNFFKFDNDTTLFQDANYSPVLWMYTLLYQGEFDGFFGFIKPTDSHYDYSSNDTFANDGKGKFKDFNIKLNDGTAYQFATSDTLLDERENSEFVYARIYDISQPPGYKGLRYKEFRPEDYSYFQDNISDFVFHHIFRHKSDADHRYLLEVYGQDTDGNARFLFMKLDVLDFKNTGSHTLGSDNSSNSR